SQSLREVAEDVGEEPVALSVVHPTSGHLGQCPRRRVRLRLGAAILICAKNPKRKQAAASAHGREALFGGSNQGRSLLDAVQAAEGYPVPPHTLSTAGVFTVLSGTVPGGAGGPIPASQEHRRRESP